MLEISQCPVSGRLGSSVRVHAPGPGETPRPDFRPVICPRTGSPPVHRTPPDRAIFSSEISGKAPPLPRFRLVAFGFRKRKQSWPPNRSPDNLIQKRTLYILYYCIIRIRIYYYLFIYYTYDTSMTMIDVVTVGLFQFESRPERTSRVF